MRTCALLIAALILCGCVGTKKRGVSFADYVDAVTIEQMAGNNVSGQVFARTIVCLNARRETRLLTALTNQTVAVVTNVVLSYVTNQTVTVTTTDAQTLATNEVPILAQAPGSDTNTPAAENSQQTVALTPNASTNVLVTTASNLTLSKAANQTVTTVSSQTQRSRQITTSTNNVSITLADNQNVSAETNVVVTVLTNVTVSALTNVSVVLTNVPVHEYFLCAEYTPPPDFTLQQGESLVLLVDGARHALTTATSPTVVVPRKGFNAVLYRVSPQLLVGIANAREVKIRLKGVGNVIEQEMSQGSRKNFKRFLVKFFMPDIPAPGPRDSRLGQLTVPSGPDF